jgi:hypothetical protein
MVDPVAPERGRLASTERGELLALATIVLTALVAVAIVLIAKSEWSQDQWVALGALAASVQAVVLILGLLFAANQVAAARSIAERERQAHLVDRLVEVTFNDVLPPTREYRDALRRLISLRRRFAELPDPPSAPRHREVMSRRIGETLDEVFSARDQAERGCLQLRRSLDALGHEGRITSFALELELIRFSRWMFRADDQEFRPSDVDLEDSLREIDRLMKRVETDAGELLRSVVPRADGPPLP